MSDAHSPVATVERGSIDLISHSSLHTERLGERLGRSLLPGDVVALWGELGTGKTVLARGIARGMGALGPVTSPTFVLVNEYEGPTPMFHVDFYRLEPRELGSVGWEEYVDLGGVVVIEWPERASGALPAERLDIHLAHVAETKRAIRLEAHGKRAEETLRTVADALGA